MCGRGFWLVQAERTHEAGVAGARGEHAATEHDERLQRQASADGATGEAGQLTEVLTAVDAGELGDALVHLHGAEVALLALLGDQMHDEELVGGEARAEIAQGGEDSPLVGGAGGRIRFVALDGYRVDKGELARGEIDVGRVRVLVHV